jgi:DNA modification methylase
VGRRYIGVELKPEYARQAAKFLESAEGSKGNLLDALDAAA